MDFLILIETLVLSSLISCNYYINAFNNNSHYLCNDAQTLSSYQCDKFGKRYFSFLSYK